ncbi:acetylserotonin O-methyltransferase-like [Argopecten irradians]|uniref:acetylserotonin O-methyltransferase-like n=1 Tax=Argopecten irradians TaxID=31199 RepID=UPI003711AB53
MDSPCFNTDMLQSDQAANVIVDIIAGATRYKIMQQCLEAGVFDNLESHGEPCTADVFAKKHNYEPKLTVKLLDTLVSFKLLEKHITNKGQSTYKNTPGTSKYLTRSRKPTLIGLSMMESSFILPLLDKFPTFLQAGQPNLDMNKNNIETDNGKLPPESAKVQPKALTKPQLIENNTKPQMPDKMPNNLPKMNNVMPNAMPCMPVMPEMMPAKMPEGVIPSAIDMKKKPLIDNNAMAGMMHVKMMSAYDGFSGPCTTALARAFDLSTHREAVDLGGGSGQISFELSREYPNMEITVFDLPQVSQMAEKLQPASTKDRVSFKSGNFLEDDIPSGDLYILSHIVHMWNSQSLDQILTKVYASLPAGGSMLVLEKVLNEDRDGPEMAITNDLLMTIMSKGQERTATEYQNIFAKYGFINFQVRTLEGTNYFDAMLMKKPF